MMSNTPATALIKTNRKTEVRCIQTCRGPCAGWTSASRAGVRIDSVWGGVVLGTSPGALENGVGLFIRGSSGAENRQHDDRGGVCWTPDRENWGQKPSGYSTTSRP